MEGQPQPVKHRQPGPSTRTETPAATDRPPMAPECMRAYGVGSSLVSCPVPLTFTLMVRNRLDSDTMVDVDCITASETGQSHHTKILDSAPAGHLHLRAVQVLTNPAA